MDFQIIHCNHSFLIEETYHIVDNLQPSSSKRHSLPNFYIMFLVQLLQAILLKLNVSTWNPWEIKYLLEMDSHNLKINFITSA